MVIVRDFEKHKYNLPVQGANASSGSSIHGAGIIDTVANFVSQNKDTSVSSASSNITSNQSCQAL